MSFRKSLSLLLSLCVILSMLAVAPFGAFAAQTEVADTGASVELAETGSSNPYGLADNVQDGQILQCWGWSYQNIKANMSTIAQQGFSAIQTSPIQSSKESTLEYYSTFYNSSWVYYQPISFAIETNSYSALGTKSDFESMCAEAEKYGVKVIVDTVFNHMANDMTENTIHPSVPSDLYNDSSCWHDISINCSNYSDRYDITHYCLSGLPDLNTSHSTVQNYCIGFLKECIDAGADGFRFDAAKHIETPSDASGTASDFWPNVLNAATEYAQSTYGTTPYYYGELLDDPGDGNIGAYTAYMSVTDNQGSNTIRSCIVNGDASGAANSAIFNGAAPSKTVQWTESHDTHKDSGTSGVSEHNINKTWAIVGSRAEVCGQYLARPSDMSTTMLGSADVTSWSYPEVKAVNNFKNHFIGESEYFSSYNSLACVERGNSGMIIVNVGGTYYDGMSAPVHTMASGTYTDAITGNTFTVADGYISGDIGDTGIAVVYDVENSGLFTEGNVTEFSIAGGFNSWDTSADKMIAIDGNTVSTTMFLDQGTYEFKVATTTGIWYGNSGTIEDTTTATSSSGWTMSSSVSDNCTLTASGGKYTFKFNVSTGKLIIEYEDTTDTTSDFYLKGSFNEWGDTTPLVYASGDNVVSATVALEAGTYTFKINNPTISVWYGNSGTINDYTGSGGWTMSPDVSNNCTLEATGGTYTFAFNLSTQKLVVSTDAVTETTAAAETTVAAETTTVAAETTTVAAETSTGIYLRGSFNEWGETTELTTTDDSNVVTTSVELEAGSYTFKMYDSATATWYGNSGTIADTTTTTSASGWTMSSSESSNCTLTATGGTYTFNYDISTCKLIVLYTPAETDPVETTYTVTFVDYDGTVLSTQTVVEGSSATAPSDPAREADAQYTYTFSGWDTDFTNITADTTVTATYTQTVNKYTVTFADYDGSVISTQSVEYGSSATAPASPAREADAQYTYTFAGWDTDYSNITADTTVTATYTQTVNKYTVTFVDYDGTVLSTQSVEYGSAATAPSDPVREGYTFTGWDVSFDNITADTTITAVYADDTVYLRGSFNEWALDIPMTATDDSNIVTAELTLEAGSYTFKLYQNEAWYGNTGTIADTTTATSDVGWQMTTDTDNCTLTASGGTYTFNYNKSTQMLEVLYTAPEYTVTFVDYDGTVLSTQTVAQGESATAPADPAREADAQYTYTFAGWDTDFTNITTDTTVTATYTQTVNKYTVTFVDYNGTVLSTQSIEYGSSATAPSDPAREADAQYTYTFSGWDTDYTNITADTTVTATYTETVNKYTVTFADYDGTVLSTQSVEYGSAAAAPADPTRDGYVFAGWDTDFSNITADTTVTATYTETSDLYYTVTFVDYDGTVLKEESVPYGGSATPPLDPLRESTTSGSSFMATTTYYIFAGWDTDYTNITADTTVTATYTSENSTFLNRVYYYFVYFKDWDGTILKQQNVKSGSTVTPPADPTREGYTFAGWDNTNFTITAETTYTATYTENVNSYTVTFVDYDGTVLSTQTVAQGASATAPSDPAREATAQYTYTFAGWDTDYSNITADTTVTATYTQTVNKYTVTFVDYDGTVLSTQSIEYGASATAPSDPAREATAQYTYTFAGWDTDYTNITADTTVTATYTQTVNKYTVTFVDYDGTVISTQSVEYGADATAPSDPTREGYTYAGWDKSYTSVTADTTVTATYTENAKVYYTVTFVDYDGTVIDTQTVEEGASATAPSDPAREADSQYTYTFAGWDTDYTNITADTTVTATYTQTVNKYTVTFVDHDGTVLSTQEVEYGASATAPSDPTREGYTFTGWDKSYTSVTADTTVTAQYEAEEVEEVVLTGTLKIDVNAGNGFKISINGGAARPQGMAYINSTIVVNSSVTVTAYEVDGAEFIGWVSSMNGQVLSADYSYTFYATGNDYIKAVYMVDYADFSTVMFVNDKASGGLGQILDMQYYVAGDDIAVPADPTQVGFDFAGWNMTEEEIQAEITAGNTVKVLATWTRQIVKVQVTVTNGTGSGEYNANSAVTVVANEAEEGYKFAYWVDAAGNIKSYETSYKFYPNADTALTAVFVEEDATINYQILVNVDVIDTTTNADKNVFYYSWYVPEAELGVTFVDAGIIAVNKANYNESTFYAGTTDSNVYDRGPSGSNIIPVNSYTWTKSNVASGDTWVAKAYVQYKIGDGDIITVYSDLVEATKE